MSYRPLSLIILSSVLVLVSGWLALGIGRSFSHVLAEHLRSQVRTGALQAQAFINFYNSITLNQEQGQVRAEALADLPAPCCPNHLSARGCSTCDLILSVWGLPAHLIAEKDRCSAIDG